MRRQRLGFALLSLAGSFAVGLVIARLVDGMWPTYSEIARTGNLPDLGLPLTFAVHLVTFGIGEETGWRGFALPHLQERRTAGSATLLLLAGWAVWHIPSFFENPTYAEMDPAMFPGWLIGLSLGAVFLAWLYKHRRKSLDRGPLVCALQHHHCIRSSTWSNCGDGLDRRDATRYLGACRRWAERIAQPLATERFTRALGRPLSAVKEAFRQHQP